ncbi:MAG: prephenate dehydratase [Halieaceae bacterium]|jgi:chorismate mutase/prephenate dehydratase|nr:prephenate dehydratase [Halieaceae bacterium]
MSEPRDLKQVRDEIDAIDQEIQALINRRARCAQEVADIKMAEAQRARERGEAETDPVFYRPEREAQVLNRIKARNEGPLASDKVAFIFREIMSACLALEKPVQVAYLGPEGTFTQAAAVKHFGHAVVAIPQGTIDSVFAQVEAEDCHYGVVPVENSTEGMVSHTLDNFMDSSLKICGEVEMHIQHHLLAGSHTSMESIERVCAHQQALAQCRGWLEHYLPGIPQEPVSSNGEAARLAAQQPGTVAIAGDMAVDQYGLEKLHQNIQDSADNTTRFLVIGRDEVPPSGNDKTSIIVSSRNRPGALFALLEPFRDAGVSLTRIDTRPSRTEKWAYVFFIEFEGHLQDARIASIVSGLEEHSILLKPLGSYPRAVL